MAGCNQEWFENLSAWHDGEVTDADARRVEAHIVDCAACRRAAGWLGATRDALVSAASTDVPARVLARAIAVESNAEMNVPRASRRAWGAAGATAMAAVAAAAAFLVVPAAHGPTMPRAVENELVDHHVAGFARERPCDFASSEPAAVASWLEEQLGYSVDVTIPSGARLLGGRLCSIEGARTAALMLLYDEKPLTVFVPSEKSAAAETAREFAGGGLRCTSGPLGKAICAKGVGQPMLAVAEASPDALASSLGSLH